MQQSPFPTQSRVDCNTLVSVHRVLRFFTFDENPLTDEGEVVGEGTLPRELKRVQVRPSDLGDLPCDCKTSSDTCSSSTCPSSSSESAHVEVKKAHHKNVKKPAHRKN